MMRYSDYSKKPSEGDERVPSEAARTVSTMPHRTNKSLFLSIVLAASCLVVALSTNTTANASGGSGDQVSIERLGKLRVEPEYQGRYNRDLFPHWNKLANGCYVREQVLRDESSTPAVLQGRYCKVRSGRWYSVYDNKWITDPALIEIDHVVALSEAWDSGAWAWDARTRELFANDLSLSITLRAVSSASNQQKSDKDPAEWLPVKAAQCKYAAEWVSIKARWRLSVDPAERLKLRLLLGRC